MKIIIPNDKKTHKIAEDLFFEVFKAAPHEEFNEGIPPGYPELW